MYIIAQTIKGKEYSYKISSSILCKNEKEANLLATHLNGNNDTAIGMFKLPVGVIWFVYKIDKYSAEPVYKLTITRNKISVKPL